MNRLGYIIGGVVLFGVMLVLFLLHRGMPMWGEDMFREDFALGQEMFTARLDSTRAMYFGRTLGLPRLRQLSKDPSIHPMGHKRALALIDYIERRQHVNDLKHYIQQIKDNGFAVPPIYWYAYFVIWRDGK